MPKIEAAIKDAIDRRARRHIRQVAARLRREVRRLRQLLAAFRQGLIALKATAAQWGRVAARRRGQPGCPTRRRPPHACLAC
jgi:hypothetical protein